MKNDTGKMEESDNCFLICESAACSQKSEKHAQKKLQRKMSRRIRSRCPKPPKLAPLAVMEQQLPALHFVSDFTVFVKPSPATPQRKLISAACIRDLILLVTTQSS